jgi:hypothetical protein
MSSERATTVIAAALRLAGFMGISSEDSILELA